MTEYNIDKERVVLTGFSQGATMAFALGARHAKDFCGVIPVAGAYDGLPADISANSLPKFYIMIGDKDDAVSSNRKAAKDLEGKAKAIELKVYENLGHEFPKDHVPELRKALDYTLAK